MAGISLSSAITGNFIRRLSAAANSDNPSLTFKSAGSASSEKVDIASTLRFGAKTYTAAMKNLNSGISLLNNSYASLEKLISITEKVVDVAKRAVEPGVGDQSRRRLTFEFRELANQFKKVVDAAKVGDYEVLDVDSLTSFFDKIGLDPKDSQSIAKVFRKFLLRPEDSMLSSELVDNTKQVSIPASAFEISGTPPYGVSKATNAALSGSAGISSSYNVYQAIDDTLVPPTDTIYIQSSSGTAKLAVAAGTTASLVTVNPTTGYSVIKSTQDFLGDNPDSVDQYYLVDTNGTVVQQMTDFSSGAPGTLSEISLSADSKTALYSWSNGGNYTVSQVVIGAFGENPATSTRTDIQTNSISAYTNLAMSNDASYGAYILGGNAYLRSGGGTGAVDAVLATVENIRDIGFLDNNQLAVLESFSGDSITSDWNISSYTAGSGTFSALQSSLAISSFSTLQGASSGATGYYSLVESAHNQIRMYDESSLLTSYVFQGSESIDSLSMAFDSSGRAKVGIAGVLNSLTGDTDTELYTLSASSSLTRFTTKWDEIFDSSRTMVKKADAYQLKADAEDLLRVLNKNRDSILEFRETVVKNAQMLRTAGLAFLQVASDAKAGDTPEQIAARLVSLIRENLHGALAQSENLDPLTVAALTNDS